MYGDKRSIKHMRRRDFMEGEFGNFEHFPERMFRRHGGLRFYILWILSKTEMTGSELMDEIETQTNGWWKPSPGSIYPLLKSLEEDSMISKKEDGKYSITEKGRGQIDWVSEATEKKGPSRQIRIRDTFEQLESLISYLEDNKEELAGFKGRLSDLKAKMDRIIGSLE